MKPDNHLRGGTNLPLHAKPVKRNFMQTIVFDLETGPLAESELSALLPPFDPAEVKTGNLKDPAKIAEKIAEAEANHRRDFIERAALDPLTGRVVAIGVMTFDAKGETPTKFGKGGRFSIIGHVDEAQTLREFWELTRGEMGRLNPMIGFNIFGFDLPFLIPPVVEASRGGAVRHPARPLLGRPAS